VLENFNFFLKDSLLFKYFLIIIIMIISAYFVLNYLKINNESDLNKKHVENLEKAQVLLSKINNEFDSNDLSNVIKNKIINDNIEKYIDDKFQKITKVKLCKEISVSIEELYQHLKSMAVAQNNKASLNLVFGVFSAAVGISILIIYMLPDKTIGEISLSSFAMLFIPKLSIVIIIETLAFFFLKLYKKSLDDAKYFINQLTEVRAHFISFKTALLLDDNELIKESVNTILKSKFKIDNEKEMELPYSADKLVDLIRALNNK